MAIQLKKGDELAAVTGQLPQSFMLMMVQNRLEQQAAINKVDQAAAPIIEALEKKLQRLTEEHANVQLQLAASLAKEQELDQVEEFCAKRLDPSQAKRERDSWRQRYEAHFVNFDRQSREARAVLAIPSSSYAEQWKKEHPGFFTVRSKFP